MATDDSDEWTDDESEDGAELLTDRALPEPLFKTICWRVLPILWLGYVLNIVDRTNLGYAQLQMAHDLNLTPQAFGFASGLFFIAYALFQVPFNHLMQRRGATRILSASMIAWGCISTATCAVTGERMLCVLRFALGIAESAYYPGTLLFLTRWFPAANSGRALAYFTTAASVGGVIASAGSGLTMTFLDDVGGIPGWRWLLATQGAPTVLLGMLLPCFVCERPEEALWLTRKERATLLASLDAPAGPRHLPQPSLLAAVQSALALPRTSGLVIQYVGVSCVMNAARFFNPTQLKEAVRTWRPHAIGLAFALVALLKVIMAPTVARWAEITQERRARTVRALFALGSALLVAAAVTMLLVRSHQPSHLASAALLLGVAADVVVQMGIPLFWALHHATQPDADAPVSIALVNAIGNLVSAAQSMHTS